jgi:hypothetical protein
MTVEKGDVPDGFNDVGLTLSVRTNEGGNATSEFNINLGVRAKVVEPHSTYVHA